MLTDVVQLWEELSSESGATGKYLERLIRPDSDIEIVLGYGGGQIALIIKAMFPSDWVKQAQVPNHFSCELTLGERITRVKFQLSCSELDDIFVWFSQDVANRLENCTAETAADLLSRALVDWSEAFKVDPLKGMSRQAQQGLFAELYYLEEVLEPEFLDVAITAWQSQNSVHDFQIEETAWEVKSFGSRRKDVHISSEDQLDNIGLKSLILAVVGMKISNEAGSSVIEIANRLIERCAVDSQLLSHFQTGLAKYGYINETSILQEYFFTPRLVAEYAVTDDFPKIISRNIPSSISNVKYVLSLASLECYLIKPITEF